MATVAIDQYIKLVPAVKFAPKRYLWSSYDEEADVLYINFKKPSYATDSELTDDDVIIRYHGNDIIGLTILHASKRQFESIHGDLLTYPMFSLIYTHFDLGVNWGQV